MKPNGKTLYFFDRRYGRDQFTAGRIVGVKRNALGGVMSVTVRAFDPKTNKYNGSRVRVTPDQWRQRDTVCGVLFRGKLVQL